MGPRILGRLLNLLNACIGGSCACGAGLSLGGVIDHALAAPLALLAAFAIGSSIYFTLTEPR